MLLTFLLALTLGPETPLAPLRTGAPPQFIRAVSGVTPTTDGGWLVAWGDGGKIIVARAGSNGQPDGNRKPVIGIDAALGTTGTGPLLLWSAGNGVFAAPLANDGSFRAAEARLQSSAASPINLACNASGCIAVTGNRWTILDADAHVVATQSGIPILAAAADPTGFLLVRGENDAMFVERIDQQTANVVTSQTLPDSISAFLAPAAAAFDGQRYAIIYPRKDSAELRGITMDVDGTFGQPRTVYTASKGTQGIDLDWNGSNFLFPVSEITELGVGFEGTVWPSRLRVQYLDRNLQPAGDFITLQDAPSSSITPYIANQGGKFYVVWEHIGAGRSVRGAQLVGASVTHAVFTIGLLPQENAVLAAADDRDLAVWTESDEATSSTTLFFRRFPDDAGSHALAEAGGVIYPAAASAGSDWLAVWTEEGSTPPARTLKGAIISPFSDTIQPFVIATGVWTRAIASGANGWVLLVTNGNAAQAIRVTRAGQALPPVDLFTTGNSDMTLASNGSNFLAAFAGSTGVRLALLDGNGQVITTGQVEVANTVSVSAATMRRGFVLATSATTGLRIWRIGTDLSATQAASALTFPAEVRLVPFGTGFLATLGRSAYKLDGNGALDGPSSTLPSPVQALAPHGVAAMALFDKEIEAQPQNAIQLVRQEIFEQLNVPRRRTLR